MSYAVCLLPALLLFCAGPAAGPQRGPRVLTDAQWRRDLQVLAEEIPRRHREPFHAISREGFAQAVAALDARIPSLADHQVIVEMARLVAAIGDGHTRLSLPAWAAGFEHHPNASPRLGELVFGEYPLRIELIASRLWIGQATADLRDVLGAEVLRLGDVSAAEALARVSAVVSKDNEATAWHLAPPLLSVPEVLHATGIAADLDHATFVVRDRSGRERTLELRPLSGGASWISARDAAASRAISFEQRSQPFWFETIDGGRAVYVRLDQVTDTPRESLAEFAARLVRHVETHPKVDRLILDLRRNGGGDNTLTRPLILGLLRMDRINERGHLFALIGRATFSAAVNLASDLERWTDAVFLGEPTGGKPSGYGDAARVVLPESGLTLRISTVSWRDWTSDEKRPWIAPDVTIADPPEKVWAGEDGVLEAALRWSGRPGLAGWIEDALDRDDDDLAQMIYLRFKTDPRRAGIEAAPDLAALGDRLLAQRRFANARTAFLLSLQEAPDSALAHAGLGKSLEALGRTAEAIASYERALALDPAAPGAAAALQRLR